MVWVQSKMSDDYITAMFKGGLEKIVDRKNFPK